MNRILSTAATGLLSLVAPASAAIIFQDTFDLGSNNDNINTGVAARQSAGSNTSNYTESGSGYLAQIFGTSLGMGKDPGVTTFANLSSNIEASHDTGGYFSISTTMSAFTFSQNGGIASDLWTSIRFGQNGGNNFVNANTPGMGLLISQSGGVSLFNGSSNVGNATVGSPGGYHTFDIRLKDVADNNPFDNSATVLLVEVYADGGTTPIITYNRSSSFDNNYITFQHHSNLSAGGGFDFGGIDIVTMQTVIPEPGTLAMLGLLVPSLMLRRRR